MGQLLLGEGTGAAVLADAKAEVLLAAVSVVLAAASLLLLLVQAAAAPHCSKALKKWTRRTALTFSL